MSKKKTYKRLTIEQRMDIQAAIHDGKSQSQIARMIGVHRSTINRELKRHFSKQIKCPKLKRLSTCNQCNQRIFCQKNKLYYDYRKAHENSQNLKVLSRKKSHLSIDTIKEIDSIVPDLIRKGQSLHHIYHSDPYLQKLCSERTIRRLVYRRELSIGPAFLRRYTRFKHHNNSKTSSPIYIKDIRFLVGRKYSDYLKHINDNPKDNIVEYDSVVGKKTDKLAILTITLIKYGFQFGLLIKKDNPISVISNLTDIFKKVGDIAPTVFKVNLCDNGTEFTNFFEIENCVGKSFYTNPYQSNNKAHCETLHRLVRYLFPKGKSLNGITQEIVNLAFSNINSYIREVQNNQTPFDLVEQAFGKEFLEAIGIVRIPNKDVKLLPLI